MGWRNETTTGRQKKKKTEIELRYRKKGKGMSGQTSVSGLNNGAIWWDEKHRWFESFDGLKEQ